MSKKQMQNDTQSRARAKETKQPNHRKQTNISKQTK